MAQFDKMHEHNLCRFFFDILRDENSSRYTMTKFAALVGLILLVATVVMSLILMWKTQVVDHVLFLELLGFILTLLGFKSGFGFRNPNPGEQPVTPVAQPQVDSNDTQGSMGDGQKSTNCIAKSPKEQADFVNDNLKD